MNMVKEADFVRWGSTRRVTALRKVDQDALWEGVVERASPAILHQQLSNALRTDNFDKFWAVASKLVPMAAPPGSMSSPSTAGAPSTLSTDGRLPDANAVRSVPLRLYLPDGPVLQDVVPPSSSSGASHLFLILMTVVDARTGRPAVLYDVLSAQVPLLFPPRATDMTASFLAGRPLAKVISQGVMVPLDAEVGWLGSVFSGADGWTYLVLVGTS